MPGPFELGGILLSRRTNDHRNVPIIGCVWLPERHLLLQLLARKTLRSLAFKFAYFYGLVVLLRRNFTYKCITRVGAGLEAKGVALKVLEQAIDTSTSTGRSMFDVLDPIAQFECLLHLDGKDLRNRP